MTGVFDIHGPNESNVTDANTIGLSRKAGVNLHAGCSGSASSRSDRLRRRHQHPARGLAHPVPGADQDQEQAYIFRLVPDCNKDATNDEDQPLSLLADCTTLCNIADFNASGTVSVQDLFDFLAAWFAHASSADVKPCETESPFRTSLTISELVQLHT